MAISTSLRVQSGGSYTVEHVEHGMVIRGPIPVDDLGALTKVAKKRGYKLIDAGIGAALGGALVLVSKASSKKWREEIDAANLVAFPGNPESQWLAGWDTGISSLTIFSALGRQSVSAYLALMHLDAPERMGIPSDPDDFGRCHRLLNRFPSWKTRLPEVSARYPIWTPFVDAWSELEEYYVKKKFSQLSQRLQELGDVSRDTTCDGL